MAKYELLYALPAKSTDAEISAMRQAIGDELAKLGVSISRNDEVGKIKLGYPMRHVRYGHYVLVNFEAEKPLVAKVTEYMRLNKDVLRHQIVIPDPNVRPITALADPEARLERREPATVAAAAPVAAPVAAGPAMTSEELEKRLSALEEDITKEL